MLMRFVITTVRLGMAIVTMFMEWPAAGISERFHQSRPFIPGFIKIRIMLQNRIQHLFATPTLHSRCIHPDMKYPVFSPTALMLVA